MNFICDRMSGNAVNNGRIAKNTMFLYMRMFLLMFVGLYTSRISLQALGVENFGVYNVVAGFIVMFGSVTGSFANAISRFIQVELGRNDIDKLKSVYSTSIYIQLLLGVFVIIVGEFLGLWFLHNKLQLPDISIASAEMVLHFSIISFVVNLLYIPNYACIVAHEKMSAFAYISILEAILKLLVAFLVFVTPYDKLITYAGLLLVSQLLIQSIYVFYCKSHFEECRSLSKFDFELTKEMSKFIGWNFMGQFSYVLNIQGTNLLLNVFFGVTVNAARGIANQVNNAVTQFINNFMVAVFPQITKSYVSGDKTSAFSLVFSSSRLSYYLMFFLSLPLLIETETILEVWLKEPPEFAVDFVRWSLLASLTTLFGSPLFTLIMADGRIKSFQICMTIVSFLPFPLSWLCFKWELPAISAYVVYFMVYFCLIFIRFYLVNKVTKIPCRDYILGVIGRVILVSLVSSIIPVAFFSLLEKGFFRFFIVCIACIICTFLVVYFIGITQNERFLLKEKFLKKIKRNEC